MLDASQAVLYRDIGVRNTAEVFMGTLTNFFQKVIMNPTYFYQSHYDIVGAMPDASQADL